MERFQFGSCQGPRGLLLGCLLIMLSYLVDRSIDRESLVVQLFCTVPAGPAKQDT